MKNILSNQKTLIVEDLEITNVTYVKAFGFKGPLKHHIKTEHEGLKIHKCHMCGRTFFQYSALKIHISNVHEVLITNVTFVSTVKAFVKKI